MIATIPHTLIVIFLFCVAVVCFSWLVYQIDKD